MKRLDFRIHMKSVCISKQSAAGSATPPASESSPLPSTLGTQQPPGFPSVGLGGQVLLLIISCVQWGVWRARGVLQPASVVLRGGGPSRLPRWMPMKGALVSASRAFVGAQDGQLRPPGSQHLKTHTRASAASFLGVFRINFFLNT